MTEHHVLVNPCTSGFLGVPCNTPGGKCCRKVLVLGRHEEYPPCPDPDDPCCQDPDAPGCPDKIKSKRIMLTEVDNCMVVGDRGVFVAPLWLDVYEADQEDPDSVLPAGVYKKFCCCEQWLQVLSCQDDRKRSIKITCETELPCKGCITFGKQEEGDDPAQIGWNPCTESMTLDTWNSDSPDSPEGDCFYTPIFGTEDGKDECGNHAANWVINQPEIPDEPEWGCNTDAPYPQLRDFIFNIEEGGEHDIEVINTETYDDDDLCMHFCKNACYAVYKSCGNCINTVHTDGFCLSDTGCVSWRRLYTPVSPFCSGQLPGGIPVPCAAQYIECHEKIIDGLTPSDVIQNPWLRNMDLCHPDPNDPRPSGYPPNANPCMHCANYHYRRCPEATCVGGPGNCVYCANAVAVSWDAFHQPPSGDTLPDPPPNFGRVRSCDGLAPDGPYCASCDDDPVGGLSCYTLGGATNGRSVEYLQGRSIMAAFNCKTQPCNALVPGDTDPGQPPFDDCDCQEHPPPYQNCIDPFHEGIALRELPRPFKDTSSFFPTSITANVFVEHEFISKNVELSFVNPTKPKEEFDQDNQFAMLEMNRRQFELISETTPISEFATTGGYATKDVPKVSQAIFLGLYEKDTTKLSIWLNASPLISFTNSAAGCRTFTFNYTLFYYCNCAKYDKNCKCEELSELLEPQQTVTFHVYMKKDNG